MNKHFFRIILLLLFSATIALFYFNFSLMENQGLYFFSLLAGITLLYGIRRRALGMPFFSKHGKLSKEWYAEFWKMMRE
jgi:hypothetical protein